MCLSVEMINFLYSFLQDHHEDFTSSKSSVQKLTTDIDYMNKEFRVLDEKPYLQKSSKTKVQNFFVFYRKEDSDKDHKKDKKRMTELLSEKHRNGVEASAHNEEERVEIMLIKKNLKVLLTELHNLEQMSR